MRLRASKPAWMSRRSLWRQEEGGAGSSFMGRPTKRHAGAGGNDALGGAAPVPPCSRLPAGQPSDARGRCRPALPSEECTLEEVSLTAPIFFLTGRRLTAEQLGGCLTDVSRRLVTG